MLKRLKALRFFLFFIFIVYIITLVGTYFSYQSDKEKYLQTKTELAQIEFETIYSKLKEQSEMIFHEQINTPEVLDIFQDAYQTSGKEQDALRKYLYIKLWPMYQRMRELTNLKQLHFHLPNNHTFLRMHRPDIFGDDLTNVRETIEYVNRYKEKVDGFEEGRVYNGFRFVYPLFDNAHEYLGCVEASFSALSVQKTLSSSIRHAQFLFKKTIVDEKVWKEEYHYVPSSISPDFLLDASWDEGRVQSLKKQLLEKAPDKLKKLFNDKLSSQKAYSTNMEYQESSLLISFIPIKNPINKNLVAYLMIITEDSHIKMLFSDKILTLFIVFIFLLTVLIMVYRQKKHEDQMHEQTTIFMQQTKMAQMGSMLSNIAHQWKQPLAKINAKLIELPLNLDLDEKNKKELEKHIEDIENSTAYMAQTIEDFKKYFYPKKEKSHFSVCETIDKLLNIIDVPKHISLHTDIKVTKRLLGFEGELLQVLITLLINALEALEENEVEDPKIDIIVTNHISGIQIIVMDNAGGVKDGHKEQIFNPYFSTKNRSKNSGIGLYMAKSIIKGMRGSLEYNHSNGYSMFIITLKES